jgi:hypothetical protein
MCGGGQSRARASSPHGARLTYDLAFLQPDWHMAGGAIRLQTKKPYSYRGEERNVLPKVREWDE